MSVGKGYAYHHVQFFAKHVSEGQHCIRHLHHRLLPLTGLLLRAGHGGHQQQTCHTAHLVKATPSKCCTEQQSGLFAHVECLFTSHLLYNSTQLSAHWLLHGAILFFYFCNLHKL